MFLKGVGVRNMINKTRMLRVNKNSGFMQKRGDLGDEEPLPP